MHLSRLVLVAAVLVVACGGSDDAGSGATAGTSGTSGQGGGGAGGSAGGQSPGGAAGASGIAGSGGAGTAGTSSTAGTAGGAGSAGATAGAAGSSGGSIAGAGGAAGTAGAAGQTCGTTQCTDCLDNDGDGLSDAFDPDCTGYLDNDEGSFATGIPGDNVDACKQDCFFDGNSGQGDDKCEWNLACDPKNPGQNLGCPYNPEQKSCPTTQSQACIDSCRKLVPNGCDCFGCCAFPVAGGTKSVLLLPGCTYADINDPVKCPVCTQDTSCNNPCETCELCLGKNELPPGCTTTGGGAGSAGASGSAGTSGSGGSLQAGGTAGTSATAGSGGSAGGTPLPQCDAGQTPCDPQHPCAGNQYCLTGCCQFIIN